MSTKVAFIDISRFENAFLEALLPQVETLIKNTQFVSGPAVSKIESELSQFAQARHCIACANGTDALQIALRATDVGRGSKVLIPDMTFWATFEAVVNAGATPITIDVDGESFHLDLKTVQEAVEKFQPTALILVHLYGWAAPETLEIRSYCKKKNIILIEDCAQAFGSLMGGKSVIGEAEIATTSFYPAKVLGASGDAGAIFCKDEKIADRSRKLINHGRSDHYTHELVGWNSRMGVFEATFLSASLPHLPARIASRKKALDFYEEKLKKLPLKVYRASQDVEENGYASVTMIDPKLREALQSHLKSWGIGTGVIYPGAMSRQQGAVPFLEAKIDRANAYKISKSILNLPCFAYIRDEELNYVVSALEDFFKKTQL